MLNDTFVPTVGLSISGGGSQSGIGGLGIWKAFDGRVDESVRAGTGGLTQVLMYLTGLSGGGAITVGTMYVFLAHPVLIVIRHLIHAVEYC